MLCLCLCLFWLSLLLLCVSWFVVFGGFGDLVGFVGGVLMVRELVCFFGVWVRVFLFVCFVWGLGGFFFGRLFFGLVG